MDKIKENALILELCKLYSNNKMMIDSYLYDSDLDLPYVLGQLQFNRIGGIAYEICKKHGLLKAMNREFRNSLKITYQHNFMQMESFLRTEDYLAGLLQNAGFPYALLKGAYLVQLYPKGLRTSNDIDILIRETDLSKIETILSEAGFAQGHIRNDEMQTATRAEIISSRINRGETVPWIQEVNWPGQRYIEIDLNFSLDYKASGSTPMVASFLERVSPKIVTSNGLLNTLSTEDFFIHLCAHLYKEAATMAWVKMKRDVSLYKFVDIYVFISHFFSGDFAKRLRERIRETGLQKECYYTLMHTKELFDLQNTWLDFLLDGFTDLDQSFLNCVYDPATNQKYTFDVAFRDWVFLPNRAAHLKEKES